MSEPDGTQAYSYPSPGRKQSQQLIDKKFRQSQPNYHPFDYRESEHSVRASWHKQKETKPSLWQPFSQRRQRELNRENSRVYRRVEEKEAASASGYMLSVPHFRCIPHFSE